MNHGSLDGLAVGEQLGHLEYTIDDGSFAAYQRLFGGDGQYPNLLAEDCRTLLQKRDETAELTTVWQRFEFLRPPVPGRRVQVGGWVREVRERHGSKWLRVASFAVDEIGTEILRSAAAFSVGRTGQTDCRTGGSCPTTHPKAPGGLARALAGDRVGLGTLHVPPSGNLGSGRRLVGGSASDEQLSAGSASALVVASWLENCLGREYGDDFRWGGRLAVVHHLPAADLGQTLVGDAVVVGLDRNPSGVLAQRAVLSVENELGQRVASGEVAVTMPSPRLL